MGILGGWNVSDGQGMPVVIPGSMFMVASLFWRWSVLCCCTMFTVSAIRENGCCSGVVTGMLA